MADKKIAITIARQLGAGGAILGKRLAERLGFRYLDDELLRLAAEKMGAPSEELARWDEHRAKFWEKLGVAFTMGVSDVGGIYPRMNSAVINDRNVFELQSQVIQESAARENCIFIGRAAFWVLRDHPGRISLFLHAPAPARIPQVMDAFKVDAAKAQKLIERIDADRARFVRETTGADLIPATQHACFDTSLVPIDAIEELVVQMVTRHLAG